MIDIIIPALIALFLLFGFPAIGIHLERKGFNNGICPECNTKLRLFDYDYAGGRGYICDKCDYCTWVSYNRVDKHFRDGENNDE